MLSAHVPVALTALFSIGAFLNGQSETAEQVYSKSAKSVLLVVVRSADGNTVAQGTGFLIERGRIVTNEHVVRGGSPVIDLGGVRIPATVELSDSLNDIAILTTAAEITASPLPLAEKEPPPGSSVYAIGNPLGLEKSISTGVVAGTRRIGNRDLLQITTPISHGSSGGPLFDSSGNVVGITAGSIEDGQNLNFAVPVSAVLALIRGGTDRGSASSLFEKAEALIPQRDQLQWSADPNSPYQKVEAQILEDASAAVARAGKADLDLLAKISSQFVNSLTPAESDLSVTAAERAIEITPSATVNLLLAKSLDWKASLHASDANEKKALFGRAERACRLAISESKQPSPDAYYTLGDILLAREAYAEADSALRRALELSRVQPDSRDRGDIFRDLIYSAAGLKHPADVDKWFNELATSADANAWDWKNQAERLDSQGRFGEAGAAWQQAATLQRSMWTWSCEAAVSFSLAQGNEDSALSDARTCIAGGTGKPKSEPQLASAHKVIASVLNGRGVYDEALSNATEALTLTPEDPWAYDYQAVALMGLQRNQEAINAAKQAIRLSDGKYGIMHFHLGSAYFETQNWQFARQSFEKAAELMPSEDASAYNTALCLEKLGYGLDAAHWYEEALRRNPKRSDREDLLNRIAALRR